MMRGGPITRRVVSPLQFLLLLQLNEGPKYGYEMLRALKDEFEGAWEPKTGTFYPALRSLEARGFVETEMREETDFYHLTERGKNLLDRVGERIGGEHKFVDRYFRAVVKWMPRQILERSLGLIQSLSEEGFDIYSILLQSLDERVDKKRKLEVLESVNGNLRKRLDLVERLRREIEEGGGP